MRALVAVALLLLASVAGADEMPDGSVAILEQTLINRRAQLIIDRERVKQQIADLGAQLEQIERDLVGIDGEDRATARVRALVLPKVLADGTR